jgi:hypothetical protein
MVLALAIFSFLNAARQLSDGRDSARTGRNRRS